MRKLLLMIVLVLVVFVALHRQRLYVWDPIANVTRDGAKVSGVRVLINYSNDVLLQDGSAGRKRLYLVQHWNKIASVPTAQLTCVQLLGCMTDADQATAAPIPVGTRGRRSPFQGVTITDRRVEFVDEDGALVEVTLR